MTERSKRTERKIQRGWTTQEKEQTNITLRKVQRRDERIRNEEIKEFFTRKTKVTQISQEAQFCPA